MHSLLNVFNIMGNVRKVKYIILSLTHGGWFVILFLIMLRTKVFHGTHYDIGFQRGQEIVNFPLPQSTDEEVRFAERCMEVARSIYPPILEEFEGLLEGSQLDRNNFTAYFFGRKEGILRGCTSFAILPPRATIPIVGRNYDWAYADRKWCEARWIKPTTGFATVSYTHHWAGSPDALNEHGLFVAMNSLPKVEAKHPGLQWNAVMKTMMETCRNAGDARRFLIEIPHLRSMTYLIADAQGKAIAVEATPEGVNIREPAGGYLIATNHRVGGKDDRPKSQLRYRRVEELLNNTYERIDEENVKTILRDHTGNICSGGHRKNGEENTGWGTIWSLIALPSERRLMIAPGHPCETPYHPVELNPQH
jgi:predicted choloylglycine hydrolase